MVLWLLFMINLLMILRVSQSRHGFSVDYDPLVTFVTTRVDPMTLEELYSHLLTHEQPIDDDDDENNDAEQGGASSPSGGT